MEVLIGGKRYGGFDRRKVISGKRFGGFDLGEEVWRF